MDQGVEGKEEQSQWEAEVDLSTWKSRLAFASEEGSSWRDRFAMGIPRSLVFDLSAWSSGARAATPISAHFARPSGC